ncbi:MAG TPA: cupin domain-containing protein, partial [Candidatus Saccharibacteria bacterium]|nr:cupin domain-containing protein [Candidatus Saccharibacteria bacterium]
CPPNVPHWHGASADTAFVQIAITGREKGETVWLEAVTDSVYSNSKQ